MPLQRVDLAEYLAKPGAADPELLRLFRPDAPLVIFDIGACEGEESIRYSRLFPRARIRAFEPLPENQRLAAENFARYGAAMAELVPLALSDHAGPAIFHVSSGRPPELYSGDSWNYGNKSSSLLPPAGDAPMFGWIEFKEKVTVQCETLDSYCSRTGVTGIDFIHMDVQGAESLVLAGARTMLPNVKAVWLEVANREVYRGQKLRTEIESFMLAHDFIPTFESSRGDEADQFYVNRRFAEGRRRLRQVALDRALRRVRRFAGSILKS